ncbi:MAG: neutral zinc metallopeptidase, partial [Rhodothermales bacterium]|nr:neutral zinc metallopeptidase [Rhodothermales bacterium]
GGPAPPSASTTPPDRDDPAAAFVSVVLASTEDVWTDRFAASGSRYREPTLVLFDRITPTACGTGSAATGPFYCPGDENVYLDLSFFRELQRLGASGDFAVAYVIAHEVGHHIQRITGVEQQVRALQQRSDQRTANQLSVRMELQADCYAGVWAHHADGEQNLLEAGDVQEGLDAAAAVGDDRLQRMAGRAVQREAFTHGSSQERMAWFRRGLETGDAGACDTFEQAGL